MLFNSYEFILLYLPFTLVIYYVLAKRFSSKIAQRFLIAMSLAFYSYWDIRNLPILIFSIGVNYLIGYFLTKKKSFGLLVLGIVFNLTYLAYFKYTNFILSNFAQLLSINFVDTAVLLPLGISFFTFTQTAYLVDVYRGETNNYSCDDYLLFVTIFPHLIAGPILYHKNMIPQFKEESNYSFNSKNFTIGIVWFVLGLAKKIILADKLAVWANQAFNNASTLTMLDAWAGSIAYTLQLYFDFSAYSEMAIGLGLMLNFNLPRNFAAPYRASSIIDFWRRWHITLSEFLKNYLYIPLGGNRTGHHLRNIFLTTLLGGLWHGAAWTFVLWGCLHGIFICINHMWRKTNIHLPQFVCWLLTFNAVNFAWIFFRAENFGTAYCFFKAMFSLDKFLIPFNKYLGVWALSNLPIGYNNVLSYSIILGVLAMGIFCLRWFDTEFLINKFQPNYLWLGILIILTVYIFTRITQNSEFIYFQF